MNRQDMSEYMRERLYDLRKATDAIMKSGESEKSQVNIEKRIRFECDFCTQCVNVGTCKNVYQSYKCDALRSALDKNGFYLKENITESKVNQDDLQLKIMGALLNVRESCLKEEVITPAGFAVMIDALFYLVSRGVGGEKNEKNK